MKKQTLFVLSFLPIASNVLAKGNFSALDSFHNNNNLWTGFDPLNGDIGKRQKFLYRVPRGIGN